MSEALGNAPILIPASRQDVLICLTATPRLHSDCISKFCKYESSIPTPLGPQWAKAEERHLVDSEVRHVKCAQPAQATRDHIGTAAPAGAGHCSSLSPEGLLRHSAAQAGAGFAGLFAFLFLHLLCLKEKRNKQKTKKLC